MRQAFSKFALCLDTHKFASTVPFLTLQAADHLDSQVITAVHEVRTEHRKVANLKTTNLVSFFQSCFEVRQVSNVQDDKHCCEQININNNNVTVSTTRKSIITSPKASNGLTWGNKLLKKNYNPFTAFIKLHFSLKSTATFYSIQRRICDVKQQTLEPMCCQMKGEAELRVFTSSTPKRALIYDNVISSGCEDETKPPKINVWRVCCSLHCQTQQSLEDIRGSQSLVLAAKKLVSAALSATSCNGVSSNIDLKLQSS